MNNQKIAIVINGKGGSGKDTFCDVISKYFSVVNVSSVDPIKYIAQIGGWNGSKEFKDRKFLSDLKQLFTEYNDLPNSYCVNEFKKFLDSENEVFFVHIREPENIKKFVDSVDGRCVTLLVRGGKAKTEAYGNRSDDEVENYPYDFVFNNTPIENLNGGLGDEFLKLLETKMVMFFGSMQKEIEKRSLPHEFE